MVIRERREEAIWRRAERSRREKVDGERAVDIKAWRATQWTTMGRSQGTTPECALTNDPSPYCLS
jgi:hypothetical protein